MHFSTPRLIAWRVLLERPRTSGACESSIEYKSPLMLPVGCMQVRKHAAEQLYISFLGRDSDLEDEAGINKYDEAADFLLGTAWDGPTNDVLASKAELANMLGL